MVWHIMKKDMRLLWVLALGVGIMHFASAALRCWLGLFEQPNQLIIVADLLSIVSLLGIVALTVGVMHQDAVPGVRQDWFIRPISRGDLILAKLSFVLLVVQAPLFIADTTAALVDGFSPGASLGAASAHNLAVLCYCALPALMIGAVTRNLAQSILVVVIGVLIYAGIFLVGMVMLLRIKTSLGGTGLSWIMAATWYTLSLAGAAATLGLQFFWRKTPLARTLIGAGGAAVILSAFIPWHTAFAIQQRFSKEPNAANGIALEFNPLLGRFKPQSGAAQATSATVYLPLRITGLASGTIMVMDRANVRITDSYGTIVYEGRSNLSVDGIGSMAAARLEVPQGGHGDGPKDAYQRIFLPAAVYASLGSKPINIDIDYFLTLFRADATDFVPATHGRGRVKDLGTCATAIDGEGDDVQIRCLHTMQEPTCLTAFLEHPGSGVRNPPKHVCEPDYSLFRANLWPDALFRFGGEIPFFDRSGLTHHPIDGPRLEQSRLVLEVYLPRTHFTRHLSVANLRLSEFVGP